MRLLQILGLIACCTLCSAQDRMTLLFNTNACGVNDSSLSILTYFAKYQPRKAGGKLREMGTMLDDIFLLSVALEELRTEDHVALELSRLVLPVDRAELVLGTPYRNSLGEKAVFIDYPFAYSKSNDEYTAWRLVDSPERWELLDGFPSKSITTDKDYLKYGEIFVSPKYPGDIRDRSQSKIIGPALSRITSKILESATSPRVRVLFAGEFAIVVAERALRQSFDGVEFDGGKEILVYSDDNSPTKVDCGVKPDNILKLTQSVSDGSPVLIVREQKSNGPFNFRTSAIPLRDSLPRILFDDHNGLGMFAFNARGVLYTEYELQLAKIVDLTNANYNASFRHTTVSFVDRDGKYSFEVDFEKYFRLTDDGRLEAIRGNAVPVTKSTDFRIP